MSTIDKIIELLKMQGKTQKDLTDYLKLNKSIFTEWKSGKSKSYKKYIKNIATYFNVSTDYLLGNDVSPQLSDAEFAFSSNINSKLDGLSNDQLKLVSDYIDFLKSQNNK